MSDITQLILDDHETFRREFAALDDVAPEHLGEIWEPLANLLEVHAAAEQAFFGESIDAIGDHNEIRDSVREAAQHPIGSAQWWDCVRHAQAANNFHMAKVEDEALPNIRCNTPLSVRVNLGHKFLKLKTNHSDAERLDTSDKDPSAYVSAIELEISGSDPKSAIGIGSLKGR